MERCNHTTTEDGVTRRCTEPAGHKGAHFGAVLVKAVVNGPDYGDMGENPGLQDSGLIPLPYPQSEPRPLFTARGDVMPHMFKRGEYMLTSNPPYLLMECKHCGFEVWRRDFDDGGIYWYTVPDRDAIAENDFPPCKLPAQSSPQVVGVVPMVSITEAELRQWLKQVRAAMDAIYIIDKNDEAAQEYIMLTELSQSVADKLRAL